MKFTKSIIFILTLLIFGCDGSYQSNDDEMVSELKTYDNSTESLKLFVAVGQQRSILTSSDGSSWTPRQSGASQNFDGITFGNKIFVAVGYNGTFGTSSDGTSWTLNNFGGAALRAVLFANKSFVAVGGGVTRNHPHLIRWNIMDFKDFRNRKRTLGNHLFK